MNAGLQHTVHSPGPRSGSQRRRRDSGPVRRRKWNGYIVVISMLSLNWIDIYIYIKYKIQRAGNMCYE